MIIDGDNENGSFLTNFDGELRDNGEEEEEDESWRKTRLERENFLRNLKVSILTSMLIFFYQVLVKII